MSIDWSFIESLEGANVLQGYVPKDRNGAPIGKSGVTIGTGIDLGQMTNLELVSLLDRIDPFPLELYRVLRPYCGRTGTLALNYLKRRPIEISYADAVMLSTAMRQKVAKQLEDNWDSRALTKFADLPSQAQTVLFSLAWNFGADLEQALPTTWANFGWSAATGQWQKAYDWMRNFPSKNPQLEARRKKEAEYLKVLL